MNIEISLYPGDNTAEFVVSSTGQEQQNSRIIHGQGKIVFEGLLEEKVKEQRIDIEELKRSSKKFFSFEECYTSFENNGLEYGQGFRTIQKIFIGKTSVLAHLQLPTTLKNSFDEFGLHPSILDGAFQSLIGFAGMDGSADGSGAGLMLPFSVGEVELINPLTESCYAFVDTSENFQTGSSRKYKILLLDESGLPLVRISDFIVRKLKQTHEKNALAKTKNTLLYLRPIWKEWPLDVSEKPILANKVLILDTQKDFYKGYIEYLEKSNVSDYQVNLAMPGNSFSYKEDYLYTINPQNEEDFSKLVKTMSENNQIPDLIIHLWSKESFDWDEKNIVSGLSTGVYSLFYLSKAFMRHKINSKIQLFHIYKGASGESQPQYSAIGAFAKAIRQENLRLLFKAIEIQKENVAQQIETKEILDIVTGELDKDSNQKDTEVRYKDGKRFLKALVEMNLMSEDRKEEECSLLKKDGIYLITGGMGGLGLIFAEYMVKQEKVTVILTGRSELRAEKQIELDNLKKWGSKIIYLPADISKRDEVEQLAQKISSEYGAINGIVHSAGVIKDALVPRKTRENFDEVLAPKIFGTVWLDKVFQDQPLDFFVLFSSVSGVIGNAGQSDYAFGNSFMDSFVEIREGLRSKGKRRGKTLSINWPLWKDGGMKVDEKTSQRMENASGVAPLSVSYGLKAFTDTLKSDFSQVIVLEGNRNKIIEKLGITVSTPYTPANPEATVTIDNKTGDVNDGLRTKVEKDLTMLIVELLKVKESDLDIEVDLGDYGIDSIVMMTMLNRIEEMYGITVEPNAVSENSSVKRLAEYILPMLDFSDKALHSEINHEDTVAEHVQEELQTEPSGYGFLQKSLGAANRFSRISSQYSSDNCKIAVIGMACRFPKSNSIEEYWDNLKNGRCMITEIPEERWRISDFYSPHKDENGKSYSKWGGFISDVYLFDADYFGIKYEDAIVMDPQHRILLELSEELIARSGYRRDEISNTRTGVFIGGGESSYIKNNKDLIPENGMKHLIVNMIQNMMAARISDFYNLKGPSLLWTQHALLHL